MASKIGDVAESCPEQHSTIDRETDHQDEDENVNSERGGDNMQEKEPKPQQLLQAESDDGWDEKLEPETEKVSHRKRADDDPAIVREVTPSSSSGGEVESARSSTTAEQNQRPSIWKQLEQMQSSKGSGAGVGGGASRFSAEKFSSSDHRRGQTTSDSSSTWDDQQRFNNRGGGGARRGGGGGGDWGHRQHQRGNWPSGTAGAAANTKFDERRSFKDIRSSSDRPPPISKGFAEHHKESAAYSIDPPRFLNNNNNNRNNEGDGTRNFVHGKGFDDSSSSSRGYHQQAAKRQQQQHERTPRYLDRQVHHEDYHDDDRPGFAATARRGSRNTYDSHRRSRDLDDYDEHDHREYSRENLVEKKKSDKNSSYWLVDADDADLVAGYQRIRLQQELDGGGNSARESAAFEPLRKALDNFDESYRSGKQMLSLVLKLADDYCQNDSDRWLKLVDQYLIAYAVELGGGYVELASNVFASCIDRSPFQKAAYISLMRRISDLMAPHEWTREDFEDARNLCDLFGRLLVSSWPPGWDSCAKESNMIVYAVMNAVQTWLQALENAATKRGALVRESVVQTSAICLCHVTNTTGRKLWLKWPDFVDQMYATLRSVIVSRACPLDEDAKLQLLDLYMKLHEWPKPVNRQSSAAGSAPKRDAGIQTDGFADNGSSFAAPLSSTSQSNMLTSRPSAFDPITPRGRGVRFGGLQQHQQHQQQAGSSEFRVMRPNAAFGANQLQHPAPSTFHHSSSSQMTGGNRYHYGPSFGK